MEPTTYAWLVIAFPLAGSILIALGYKRWPGRMAGWIGTAAIGAAFLSAIGALVQLLDEPAESRQLTDTLYSYASADGIDIGVSVLVDPLSVFMALVVTGVSMLIHLYSVSYLASDEGYSRFFSYLNFFVFSMLLLVLAGNFALLIVGWAFVGFASYALISFWYRRQTATAAGMKAFVINVIGDVGLVLAAFLLLRELGTLDFLGVFSSAPGELDHNGSTVVWICVLLLIGAFAKSAQIPLHTWLADAMEGPTPVSALIHAATMVTAGVYLIARTFPLFELAPTAADIAAFTGLATLIMAATIALAVTDLKRIIAYSTISQIGYMVMGVSIGAYTAGLFHLMTHAFFKALLFMAAGSVIAAMAARQSIDEMSGFRRALPLTSLLLVIGALALAGFPGFSGFFSKDEILVFAAERGGMYWTFAIGGYLAAFLTAFYSFRIVFRVCYGEPCEEARELEEGHLAHPEPENPMTGEPEDTDVGFPGPEHHIAERSAPMRVAMTILGALAIVGGVLQIPGVSHVLEEFFEGTFAGSALFEEVHVSTGSAWLGLAVGALTALAGIALAWYVYVFAPGATTRIRERFSALHDLFAGRWYFDELYDALVYRPVIAAGALGRSVVERFLIDGAVAGTVGTVRGIGASVRTIQSGYVRFYAALLLGGSAVILLYFLLRGS